MVDGFGGSAPQAGAWPDDPGALAVGRRFEDRVPPRAGGRLVRVLAACVGLTLGAMLGSLAGDDGEGELPSGDEVVAIAETVWPERALGSLEPGSHGYSQGPHEDLLPPAPGWLRALVGDDTQDRGHLVGWPPPQGWAEAPEGRPHVDPESPADNERRLAGALERLAAAGWEAHVADPGVVEGRRDGVLVRFFAEGGETPSVGVWRVPSQWHTWLVLVGAVLGGFAGWRGARAVGRRGGHPSGFWMGLGLVAAVPSFLVVAAVLVFSLLWESFIEVPLWRAARFWPVGALLNVALLALVAGGVWHVLRGRGRGVDG
ncbi:hypothetical protein AB0I28_16080 [Phytomonospora sp. NPDC050363]|uniref:hypothetical protein n=1 Tax=Phytomonospora sp. NPDC050363 TaxID=3155642 RepID=UPI00340CFEFD